MPAHHRARGAFALLLAALLLLGSVPAALADTDLDIGGTAIIANTGGDPILFRTGPGYGFYVLAQLPPGTTVGVLAGPVAGDDGNLWYKVNVNGTDGYVFATFLVRPESAPAAAAVQAATTGGAEASKAVVGTGGDGLRLRDGADLSAAILTVIPEGATVALTGSPRLNGGQTWYPVAYAGVDGWAVADYLGATGSGASAPVTDQQALALAIDDHVAVSGTGGWNLRLRATPSLDSGAITAAPEGAVLQIRDGPLADDAGNVWYGVSYAGAQGYASAAYLTWTNAALSTPSTTASASAGQGSAALSAGAHVAVSNTGGWDLRIRTSAGTAGGAVAAAPEGAVLRVTAGPTTDSAGDAWYAVDYDGIAGYVKASYLSATTSDLSSRQPLATTSVVAATSGPALTANQRVAVSNTGGWSLRIREWAGLDGATNGAADEGTVLRVLSGPETDSEGNAWYAVDYDGLSGYARASYLSPTDNAPSTRTVAPAPAPVVAQAAAPEPAAVPANPAPSAPPAPAPSAQPVAQTAAATGHFIWPLNGTLTQGFGSNPAYYGPGGHNGIDIAAAFGSPIVAADAGTVVFAGWNTGGLGNAVIIDHGNGFRTVYGHASSLNVSAGQRVQQGQVIMFEGSTGDSTGPHCHFSVILNGVYVNPQQYLPGR